jgi:ribosomal RNA assembly protein
MRVLRLEGTERIRRNIKEIERKLNVKINFNGKTIQILGDPIDEEVADRAIEAIDMGFPIQEALILRDDDFVFNKLNIKDLTRRHDLERVRARLIGTKGKTLRTLEDMSHCSIVLHGNFIGIIGRNEDILAGINCVKNVVSGLKESSVFSMLDRRAITRAAEISQIKEEALELEEERRKKKKEFEKERKVKGKK